MLDPFLLHTVQWLFLTSQQQHKISWIFTLSRVCSTFIKLKVLWPKSLEDALLTQADDAYKTSPVAAKLLGC